MAHPHVPLFIFSTVTNSPSWDTEGQRVRCHLLLEFFFSPISGSFSTICMIPRRTCQIPLMSYTWKPCNKVSILACNEKRKKTVFPKRPVASFLIVFCLFLSLRLQDIKTGYADITLPCYFARKLAEKFGNVACNKGWNNQPNFRKDACI